MKQAAMALSRPTCALNDVLEDLNYTYAQLMVITVVSVTARLYIVMHYESAHVGYAKAD